MRIDIVTLFPELFEGFVATSFVGKAIKGGELSVRFRSPREHGLGKHRSVDDTPYGGGSGMVGLRHDTPSIVPSAAGATRSRARRSIEAIGHPR